MEQAILVKEYITPEGFSQIAQWRKAHPDFRAKIDTAIVRLEAGNTSAIKWLPGLSGIGEYRINWGPGLRLYLMRDGGQIIILLCAGDKSSQKNDIELAGQYRKAYLQEKKKGK